MDTETASLRSLDIELEERADLLLESARELAELRPEEREQLRERVLAFLQQEIGAHITMDERVLYPAVCERLGDPLVAAPLRYEHRAIRWWIDEIARADITDVEELRRLLYGMHALLRVHLSREEELYADALDSPGWPASG
jgi:Hemerythrin HHE cation binding domain